MIRLTKRICRDALVYGNCISEIISLAYINDSKDWRFALHKHEDHCELIYVSSGEGTYSMDQEQYEIQAGDVVILNCGVGHVQISNPDNPIVAWNLSFQVHGFDGLPENHILPEGARAVMPSGNLQSSFEECCQMLFDEMKNKLEGYEEMSFLWAERLLLLSKRLWQMSDETLKKQKVQLVDQVKEYIDQNYKQEINLEKLAAQFHISKYHISHQMKTKYKISPIDYVIERRLGEAQNLLCTTNDSITEIAKNVGYDNINYFNRLFNKRLGLSPTEFRVKYTNLD